MRKRCSGAAEGDRAAIRSRFFSTWRYLKKARDQVPAVVAVSEGSSSLDVQRLVAERQALTSALQRADNNRSLAARLLGISRRTLYNKLETHGLLQQ